jgi:hypothetical protein
MTQAAPHFRPALLSPLRWPAWIGLGLIWLTARLPYNVLLRIGRIMGWLSARIVERRPIAERNLEFCFPDLNADERARPGHDAEGVVRREGDVLLDDHGRIVPEQRELRSQRMPSFDTVLEPNMVEVKNAVDNAAKEIGTRVELVWADKQPHGFFNRSPWQERTLREAEKFLISIGYLKSDSTLKVPVSELKELTSERSN